MDRYWWFGPADNRLRYHDRREVKPGLALSAPEGELVPCQHGMHASKLPLDALSYAPISPVAWRVELQGKRLDDANKSCARTRLHLWAVKDTDAVLRHFARLCALDVIHLWDAPEILARYLKTGDESIRDAAPNAAWSTAWSTAWTAARTAGETAAWTAAREKQNNRLHRMLMAAERRDG